MNIPALSIFFPFPHAFSSVAMLCIFLELFFLSPTVSVLHEAFYLFSGIPGKAFPVSPGKEQKWLFVQTLNEENNVYVFLCV